MNKNFIMLSGLPRSGSSVLGSMLNQHPQIYATTTSPLADFLDVVNKEWPVLSQAIVNPDPNQHSNIIAGIIDGAYKHIDKSVLIDKNRLWPRYGEFMRLALGYNPKIICTVRSIPDILASYILLIEKNNYKVTFVDEELTKLQLPINNKNRCRLLWEKYTMHPYTSLRMGYASHGVDLLFVEYEDIVGSGQSTLDRICDFIGINHYQLSTDNLQSMEENDNFHGGLDGLHDVRPVLSKTSPPPEKVIGHELTRLYKNMKLEFWREN
jgi:sulfotransferase